MNDLAERALQGASTARRQVLGHPSASLGVSGFVVAAYVVVAGGAAADARPTRTLTTWLGLQNDHGLTPATAGALLLGGLVALVLLWLVALRLTRHGRLPEGRLWRVVAAWTVPFAVGPPLMDTTAYSSVAFGFVQRAGDDPSTHAPASLGDGAAIVDAIVPTARGTVSAAGPLGSLLQHVAIPVGGGSAVSAVIVLRVVGVVAALAIGRLAADLAAEPGGAGRVSAIALTSLNPLLLLYVVSSPHLEGPMLACVLASLVAARRRRRVSAVVLAVVAGEIAPVAFVVVAAMLVRAGTGATSRRRVQAAVRDVVVAGGLVALAGFALPDGWGWLRAASHQFSEHTPYSIPYATGRVLAPIVAGASYDDLVIGGRLTAVIAAVVAVGYLLVTAGRRTPADTAGLALLAMALLAPNLYPWYLLWGLMCLAAGAVAGRRIAIAALTAAGCVLTPPGFGDTTAVLVTAGGLFAVLVVVVAVTRRAYRPPETSRTAGRTSAR